MSFWLYAITIGVSLGSINFLYWKKKGYIVKKGEKAFIFFSSPKSIKTKNKDIKTGEDIETAFNRLKLDINDDSLLFQLQQELLLNTSIFFVKIFKVKFPNYFGSLVVINFYLSDHIISIIK